MEQRRLRLGDILDDYCPRERRVTNHAVVAMIEEDVKQTRCTTCDAEHVYKGGKAPRKRKAATTGALYREVLAGIEEPTASSPDAEYAATSAPEPIAPPRLPDPSAAILEPARTVDHPLEAVDDDAPDADVDGDALDEDDADGQIHMLPPDEGPVHRPLIRAQLPRPDGMKVERQAPEFTIRQNNGRGGGGFRPRGNGNGNGNGNAGPRFGRGGHQRGDRRGPQGFSRGPGGGGGRNKRSR